MYHSKVMICGVNTSKLKVLTEEEKRELMKRVRDGDESARQEMICGWFSPSSNAFRGVRRIPTICFRWAVSVL